ncbi:DUF4864 domain-containing protein [Pararhodobacter sp.]|uniref:DUF4864 domain-containing protein n=1 Tax=Pararhodobacter sp. TaxID=2127056 RepID=UPI002FE3DAA0
MRRTLLLPLFLSLAGPAFGQSATEVIDAQIEALRQGDYETAFTFAAPALHEIFRTPANFGRMIERGYPMVLDPAEVRYLDHGERAGYEVQNVLIQDRAGAVFLLEYLFIGEGPTRRIAGVRLLPETGTGV